MKICTMGSLPELKVNQCYIIFAEVLTGIVINLDGTRNFESEKFPILLFDSFEEAKNFAEAKLVEIPNIECSMYNHKKEFIELISNLKK